MSGFDERENAFENKYAYDEEVRFKAEARRNKLLGLWAAEMLGKKGQDADDYAKEVVIADMQEKGDNDVFTKVYTDLQQANVAISESDVRSKMIELMQTALEQVQAG